MVVDGKILLDFSCFEKKHLYKKYLEHPAIAGIVIPASHCLNEKQTASCIHEIRKIQPRALIVFSPDLSYEHWLMSGCLTHAQLGKLYTYAPEKGKYQARMQSQKLAIRLKYYGFDASLDINFNPGKGPLGQPSMSSNVHNIIGLMRHYIQGQQQAGFPIIAGHCFPSANIFLILWTSIPCILISIT